MKMVRPYIPQMSSASSVLDSEPDNWKVVPRGWLAEEIFLNSSERFLKILSVCVRGSGVVYERGILKRFFKSILNSSNCIKVIFNASDFKWHGTFYLKLSLKSSLNFSYALKLLITL